MTKQINLRLPDDLLILAEKYANQHGYKNVQELVKEALRDKLSHTSSIWEKSGFFGTG